MVVVPYSSRSSLASRGTYVRIFTFNSSEYLIQQSHIFAATYRGTSTFSLPHLIRRSSPHNPPLWWYHTIPLAATLHSFTKYTIATMTVDLSSDTNGECQEAPTPHDGTPLLKKAKETGLSPDEARAFQLASQVALDYRQQVPNLPVRPTVPLDQAVARFRQPLPTHGEAADKVIQEMVAKADGALHQMSSGNFYGYVLGGSMPVGVAADMIVSAWGQNCGSAKETPACTGMERTVCDWVLDLLGLPADCGVGLVTGASVANTVSIMAARNALLEAQNWNVEENGLFGAPEIPVLIGEAAHSAPLAALRYAGLGALRVTTIKADNQGRIMTSELRKALEQCARPPLVILQAGQINSGAFDPFEEIIPLVHAKGGWVHVDGAFGLWLAAVPSLVTSYTTRGVHLADSWAVDLHKWLNAPFDAGVAIVRKRRYLVASMSARGAYLPDLNEHWEPTDSTMELSRRARGVPTYAILKHLGKSGVRELITRHVEIAKYIAAELARTPGLTILNDVVCNQIAVVCGNKGPQGDAQTKAVLNLVQQNGKTYPSHGVWQGRTIIRISVICYATTMEHARTVVAEIQSAWNVVQTEYGSTSSSYS